MLQAIDPETCPDLKVFIISNGTLFSESEYNKFPNIHGKLAAVRISTDAATREAFRTEVGGWSASYEPPSFSRDEKNVVKSKTFLNGTVSHSSLFGKPLSGKFSAVKTAQPGRWPPGRK